MRKPTYDAHHCGLRLEAYLCSFNLNVRRRTFSKLRMSYRMEVGSSFAPFEHDGVNGLATPPDPSED
jgi:hypothetical protein